VLGEEVLFTTYISSGGRTQTSEPPFDRGGYLGFVWRGGEHTILDVPGSADTYPNGINNKGVIVGSYRDSSRTVSHGFLASPPPVLPGWSLLPGNGRTPSGPTIVHFKGQLRAFVRGTNNRIYQTRKSAAGWAGWSEVPGNGFTLSEPGAVVFKGELYLFVRGKPTAYAFVLEVRV
jgi:hypothetical protein